MDVASFCAWVSLVSQSHIVVEVAVGIAVVASGLVWESDNNSTILSTTIESHFAVYR
jgi:hypothetical protein